VAFTGVMATICSITVGMVKNDGNTVAWGKTHVITGVVVIQQ